MDETMHFDADLLLEYQELLQTTRLIACYREFIRLFRWVRVELEKRMPEYKFQGSITENGMDFSYFQFTSPELKEKGLKVAVVFIHRDFQFQVWVSGFNRRYQAHYCEVWKDQPLPFELTGSPAQTDYILRAPLKEPANLSDGGALLDQIQTLAENLLQFVEANL